MRKFIVCVLLLASACASAEKKWFVNDVSDDKKVWRHCHERLDGVEKHRKGHCYISQRCYKTILGNLKCEPIPLFCAYGDLECYGKYGLFDKTLR